MSLINILKISQIILAILLTVAILMQNRGGGLSGIFGGTTNYYATKRGFEKKLFISTIVIAAVFLTVSLVTTLL